MRVMLGKFKYRSVGQNALLNGERAEGSETRRTKVQLEQTGDHCENRYRGQFKVCCDSRVLYQSLLRKTKKNTQAGGKKKKRALSERKTEKTMGTRNMVHRCTKTHLYYGMEANFGRLKK